jgi:hypothetical protein
MDRRVDPSFGFGRTRILGRGKGSSGLRFDLEELKR